MCILEVALSSLAVCSSTKFSSLSKMHCGLCFLLALTVSIVGGSPKCSKYEFPCANGECIDSVLWCDSHVDCADGSDEKLCRKTGIFNKDPNKCPSTYFKCKDGPCIPMVGRCNGYEDCSDSSDEKNCPLPEGSTTSTITSLATNSTVLSETHIFAVITPSTTIATVSPETIIVTTNQAPVGVEESLLYLSDSFESNRHSVENGFSGFNPTDYSEEREKARDWLLAQRRSDFGWESETPRALAALHLSDVKRSSGRNASDMLMVKQLEVQLSLHISRNGTKVMKLTELALYINALLASCKDPDNFYGEKLVRTLRNGVDAAQRAGTFVNPSVYLTLCLNNATTYDDMRKLHEIIFSRNDTLNRLDIQALALLATTCISRSTNFLPASAYDDLSKQFQQNVNIKGFPGNVYEASLLFQALQEMKANMPGLLEFILREQEEDGSFGDVLSTYLVLPVLAGRSFLQMNDHCSQKTKTDLAPIEVLKNMKRRQIYVQYALYYGNAPETTQTIHMIVAEGISFLDVMRLAQDINPKFRFLLDDNGENPVVYSIGGIPNDAERGIFWTLYISPNSDKTRSDLSRLTPFTGNIKQLVTHANDEFVFWIKSI